MLFTKHVISLTNFLDASLDRTLNLFTSVSGGNGTTNFTGTYSLRDRFFNADDKTSVFGTMYENPSFDK